THPKTHALSLIKCGWNITLSNSVDTAIRIDLYSAQRCTALPTRYESPDLIRELKDVTRCTPSPVLLSPLRRRPMAHTSCPKHTKPAAHSAGRLVARYGLFPTAREPVLNCQCGQTLGPWLHHTGAPRHPQVTTRGTPGPHRSHQRVFPQFLLTHTNVLFTHAT